MAQMLAERHQQIINDEPVAARQALAQRILGLLRGASLHVAPAVGDPMHVRIHANARLAIRQGDHEVGRLAAHALNGEQLLQVIRHPAAVAFQYGVTDGVEGARFGAVKPDRIDGALDGGEPPLFAGEPGDFERDFEERDD